VDDPAIELAARVFERVVGRRPVFLRGGGTLPVLGEICAQGIPTVGTGFGLPDANVHSPNEHLRLEHLPLGIETAKELYRAFAALG
jgi:acetylornithine deacetylase/succinyl-diaminopimelate desuccinylase-like protein